MPTSDAGSPEQLLQETGSSAIKRINLGITLSINSSAPIPILPPLETIPSHNYHPRRQEIALKHQSPGATSIRISFHPLIHLARMINCLPSLTDLNLIDSLPRNRQCGWLTSQSISLLPLIHSVWLAEQSAHNYTLLCGLETYSTFLRHQEPTLFVTIWAPETKSGKRSQKVKLTDWQVLLEATTLPILIDIFCTQLHPHLFEKGMRAKFIFWLDTLGLLSLLFKNMSIGSCKHAALAAADLSESTYNSHTRELRERQQPLSCLPTPSSGDQKQDPGLNVAPGTVATDSGGPAMTSTDNATNKELPPEEDEKERADDGSKYGTPLF